MDEHDTLARQRRSSFVGLLLVLFFGTGGVLFLIFVTGGFFLYVVAAVVAIMALGCLHYLLWGQAMNQQVAGEREEAEARERWEADDFPPPPPPHRRF